MPLTDRQKIVLDTLKKISGENGYMPSSRELADALGMGQTGAVNHLKTLEKKGYIKRVSGKARAISILKGMP